ncbi:MAG: hypothetical protein IID50_03565 [Proteobacteria bacterium]|nr:hypothetical protein [Pseudomonadota bacterium]
MSTTRTDKRKVRPKPRAPRKPGRPTRYTPEVAADICTRLAGGESLRAICRDDAMPSFSAVINWLFDGEHDEFVAQYTRAREAQAEVWADEIVGIADEATGDSTTDKDGKEIVNHEHIQRSRLRVDARKWIASKLLPKRYGDRLQHTGEGGGPIRTEVDLTGIPTDVLCELRKLAARI